MPNAAELKVKVSAEGVEATKKGLGEVDKKVKETESSFAKAREQIARGFEFGTGMQLAQLPIAGFEALKEQFVDVIKVAIDHQQVLAQTDAVLKSTASAFHGAETAVQGHYVAVGISAKQHAALQKQLDSANYSLQIATDRWQAAKHHTQAATDQFAHAKEKVAQLNSELGKTGSVLVGGKSAVAATFQATKEEVLGLAESLSQVTPYSNDAILGMENLVLTFTQIGRDTLPMATKEILNVSTAMHEDLKSAAVEVGKALGDPTHGMTALQRIGVTFNETQKETVKHMMKVGDVAGAQQLILKELDREFGGSAEAAGKTFGGALQIAQNRVEELKIKIGTALLPILNEFLQYFEQHILPRLDDFSNWFQKDGIPKLQQFGQWFQTTGIPMLSTFGQNIGTVVGDLMNFVQWLKQGSNNAELVKNVLKDVGLVILGIKMVQLGKDALETGKNMVSAFSDAKDAVHKFVDFMGGSNGIGASMTEAEKTTKEKAVLIEGELAGEEGSASIEGAAKKASTGIKGIGIAMAGLAASVGILIIAEQITEQIAHWAGIANTGFLDMNKTIENMNGIFSGPIGDFMRAHGLLPTPPSFTPGQGEVPPKPINSEVPPTPHRQYGPRAYGHASGILNNPSGHWATVGEQGPETMYVPQGASILPHGMSPSSVGGGSSQPIILMLDGYVLARGMMPQIVDSIRHTVGVKF